MDSSAQKSGSSNGIFSLRRLAAGSGDDPIVRVDARSIVSAIDGQLSISSRKFSSSMISCIWSTKKLMQYSFKNAALNFSAAHKKRPILLTESTSWAATSQRCFSGSRRYCSESVKRSISCYKKRQHNRLGERLPRSMQPTVGKHTFELSLAMSATRLV